MGKKTALAQGPHPYKPTGVEGLSMNTAGLVGEWWELANQQITGQVLKTKKERNCRRKRKWHKIRR